MTDLVERERGWAVLDKGKEVFRGPSHRADLFLSSYSGSDELPAYKGKTTAQLQKIAKAEGIDLSGCSTNDEREAAIAAARGEA